MKPWQINILIILGIIILIILDAPQEIFSLIVFASIVWVFIDARKLNIGRYKPTFFGRGPISYTLCINLLWLIGFPFYISHRQKIIDGKWPLKQKK